MFVFPANRTRIVSNGNDVLIAVSVQYRSEMWGYATGNPAVIGAVVLLVVAAAVAYLVQRWMKRSSKRK
jgi:high-affinity Fe2+/Pb2+ permease